jgi:integrase/recombinase XerD
MGHKEVPVTQLRQRVLEELERRNYSQATARAYVAAIRRFAEFFGRSPEQLDCEHIRQYQIHLRQDRKLRPKSVMVQMAALRFLYLKVLRRSYSRDDLPLPKQPRRQIPLVLSPDEVTRLINAAPNLRYRTILMTLYSTGMRRAELCQLRPEDIDKERMILRIPHGKGGKAREVPLSQRLLDQLRVYYRSLRRRNGWMFPSLQFNRPNEPITDKVVWHACRQATRRAAIAKAVHPHTLRHCFATHLLDNGAELPAIQILLGHEDPRDTMIYLHLSTRKLKAAPNPLETLDLTGPTGREQTAS